MARIKNIIADIDTQKQVYLTRREEDRRLGLDRRWFSYDAHIPERRSSGERRSGKDRRLIIGMGTARTRVDKSLLMAFGGQDS